MTLPTAVRVWDGEIAREGIEASGNLVLAPTSLDWMFIDSGGSPSKPKGLGNGQLVTDRWKLTANWRELEPPTIRAGWIPPAAGDHCLAMIAGVMRDSSDANYLRPDADSPLATGGAGGDLPRYVGALPPAGATAWDWQKTWDSREGRGFPLQRAGQSSSHFAHGGEIGDDEGIGGTVDW